MPFEVHSNAFGEGQEIPQLYTCDGANISPSLEWSGGPAGTLSYALIVDDPDAPGGTWNHWLLWDIPPDVNTIPQGIKTGQLGVSGKNDFGKLGYGGPCPPRGHGFHRYYFHLTALNVASLGLKEGEKRAAMEAAMHGHVLEKASYWGKYKRG